MPISKETLSFDKFDKGIMDQVHPFWSTTVLPDGFLKTVENMDIMPNGHLQVRGGYIKHNATNANMDVSASMCAQININGVLYEIVATQSDGKIFFATAGGTTFTQPNDSGAAAVTFGVSSTPDRAAKPIVFNDVAYFTNITGNGYKFDGATWTKITDRTLNGSGNEFPLTSCLLVAHERVWAAGVGSNQNRLHYSSLLLPETWPTNNYIEVNPDDGQFIRAAVLFNNQIVIFKDRSVYILTGNDESSFSLSPLTTRYGLPQMGTSKNATRSILQHNGILYWLDGRYGIVAYDGATTRVVSEAVDATYVDAGDAFGSAVASDNKLIFSVGTKSFVYFIKENAWTQYTYSFTDSFASVKDNITYGLYVSSTGGLFKMLNVATPYDNSDTVPVPWKVTTGRMWVPESDSGILPSQTSFLFSRVSHGLYTSADGTNIVAKVFADYTGGVNTLHSSTYVDADVNSTAAEEMKRYFIKNVERSNNPNRWYSSVYVEITGTYWGTLHRIDIDVLSRRHAMTKSTGS
jgi:hypothetical protein